MNIALEVRAAAQPLTLVETLAHELRQPLSAIESTAYYLAMVLPPGEKRAQEQAARLQRLVEHASWILSCAVQLEDEAPLAPESVDLEELITQTAASRSAGGHAPPRMILAGNLPSVKLDPGRGRALMENLFGMLGRASARPVCVQTSRLSRFPFHVVLEFTVDLSSEVSSPSLSTDECDDELESCLGAGASLGIESARRIVESHEGSFKIDFDPARGVHVRIHFPPSSSQAMLPATVFV